LPPAAAAPTVKPKPSGPEGKKSGQGTPAARDKNSGRREKSAGLPFAATRPGPGLDPVPDTQSEKEPEIQQKPAGLPEKISVPVKDPAAFAEPENIPAIIRKFLHRRKAGMEIDPGSA
jgi:hypothetical protein